VDPFSLLLLAQSAVSFIKEGDMLREGQVAVDELQEQAESLVGQAQEVYETVSGLWQWATPLRAKLVGAQPVERVLPDAAGQDTKPKHRPDKPARGGERSKSRTPTDASRPRGQPTSGRVFDIQQKVANHYKDLEMQSLNVYDPDQNNAKKAIERVEVELIWIF